MFPSQVNSLLLLIIQFLQNHVVERLWPEVNRLINYPIKRILVALEAEDEIDLHDDLDKYIVSEVTLDLLELQRERFVMTWNNHAIPRKEFSTF